MQFEKILEDKTTIILLSILMVIAFRGWFYPGLITHGDWRCHPIEAMANWFSFPYSWQDQINSGPMQPFTLTNYPIRYLFGLLAQFGFGFGLSERILYHFLILFLSILSMYYLTHIMFKNRIASFFSSLLFGLNTYVLLLRDHLTIRTAYFLAPLVLAFFIKSLVSKKLEDAVITGFLFAACMAYEVRISYIVLGILLFYSIYNVLLAKDRFAELLSYIRVSSASSIVAVLLGGYWILPYFFSGMQSRVSSALATTPWISWMTVLDAMTLRHSFYTLDGEIRSFIVQDINPIFFLIPILSFFALFLKKRDKNIMFFALLSIIGIFLVKQENFPFGGVYTWLFKNFPGFDMFRESSKFYLLIALGYSALFGVAVAEIHKRIKNLAVIFKKEFLRFSISANYISIIFLFLVLSAQLAMAWPIASGSQLSDSYYPIDGIPHEYWEIQRFITEQSPNEFRTLWLPYASRFSFYSSEYSIITPKESEFLESLLIQYFEVTEFQTKNLGAILDLIGLNIRYVVLAPDLPMWEEKLGEYIYHGSGLYSTSIDKYRQFLDDQVDLERIELGQNIYVYENKKYNASFFEVKPSDFGLEDPSSVKAENLTLNSDFEDQELKGWSINDVDEQNISLCRDAYEGTYSLKIELYNSTYGWKILRFPLVPAKYGDRFSCEFYVKGENSYAVHKKLVWYDENRTITAAYYMGAVGESNFGWKRDSVNFTSLSTETAYIQLQIWYGHQTTESLPNRLWIDSAKVYVHSFLDLDTIWLSSMWKEKESSSKLIGYQRVDPTKYVVNANVSEPFLLSFGETYDPLWIAYINGKKIESTLLYPIVNGFQINQTGQLEITIEYEPQKWFYCGSIISITTFIACITYLGVSYAKAKKLSWKVKEKVRQKLSHKNIIPNPNVHYYPSEGKPAEAR